MNDGRDMIRCELPKEKHRFTFCDILTLFLLLSGAVGGGLAVSHVLEYFGVHDVIVYILSFLYWVCYCMLVLARIRTKSDDQRLKDKAYSDGYLAGKEESAASAYAAGEQSGYDRGYQAGLLDGRADGWDHGYSTALKDQKEGGHQ